MLSFKPLFNNLLNPFSIFLTSNVISASESTIFNLPLKPRRQPRDSQICCFGRRQSHPQGDKMAHRVELLLYDQTISTLSADDFEEEMEKSTLVDIRPLSEKGFTKMTGSKLTWHGETARSLDEWHHLNSVSPYVPLSPIALWEDTDIDLEDEDSYDWFGETPPVILTTGSNSIFLRHVLPGLKLISSRATTQSPSILPATGFVQRMFTWFNR